MSVTRIVPPGDHARADNGQVVRAIAPAACSADLPEEALPDPAAPAPEADGRGAVVLAFHRRRKARGNSP